MPERNFTQDSSVPRIADPMTAPMISWAIVPTTISESAVEIRSQIEIKLAISARLSHNAASAQTPVMKSSLRTGSSRRLDACSKTKTRLAAGRKRTPTA